eukprot:Rmarinus@m.225
MMGTRAMSPSGCRCRGFCTNEEKTCLSLGSGGGSLFQVTMCCITVYGLQSLLKGLLHSEELKKFFGSSEEVILCNILPPSRYTRGRVFTTFVVLIMRMLCGGPRVYKERLHSTQGRTQSCATTHDRDG